MDKNLLKTGKVQTKSRRAVALLLFVFVTALFAGCKKEDNKLGEASTALRYDNEPIGEIYIDLGIEDEENKESEEEAYDGAGNNSVLNSGDDSGQASQNTPPGAELPSKRKTMTGPMGLEGTVVVGKAPGEESGGNAGASSGNTAAKGSVNAAGGKLKTMQAIPTAAAVSVHNYDGSVTEVVPEPTVPLEKIVWNSCLIEGGNVVLRASLTGGFTPSNTKMGEDTNLYLLELKPYEDEIAGHRFVASVPKNQAELSFTLPLNFDTADTRLYNKFIACIWDGSKYIAVSEPTYISNPEAAAKYTDPYQEPLSKKGLFIELDQIADAFELGVHSVIVNIPFNALFGSGIEYEYDGEVYHFNKAVIEAYDKTISMFSNKQMNVNAVILNGWNDHTPDFFYPGTTKQTQNAAFYHFNAKTEQGYKDIKATASFLAERYSGQNPNHGRIQNWIIGNEVNNQYWNYIGAMELPAYVKEYERSFRVFYNAIKSTCANGRVFFSLDHNWMNEANGTTKYNGRDFLDQFARSVKAHGNIDWGLAYHPYSVPLTEPEFWDDAGTGLVSFSESSPVVNFANLSVLTDYMQRSEMRDRNGSVRHIILSEQGFTSKSATRGEVEKLQAAAFAYAYYIVDSNPYIDTFILSRQIDAPSEVKLSMAFGLWTTDATEDVDLRPAKRKYIWPVFKNIDQEKYSLESTAFAKEILGIEKWSDVIPNFKWARLEE